MDFFSCALDSQGIVNFFCKGLDNKYFGLCGPCTVSHIFFLPSLSLFLPSSLPLTCSSLLPSFFCKNQCLKYVKIIHGGGGVGTREVSGEKSCIRLRPEAPRLLRAYLFPVWHQSRTYWKHVISWALGNQADWCPLLESFFCWWGVELVKSPPPLLCNHVIIE